MRTTATKKRPSRERSQPLRHDGPPARVERAQEDTALLSILRALDHCDLGPGHVDVHLTREQNSNLAALHTALVGRHARLKNGRFVDPNGKCSALAWLLEQLRSHDGATERSRERAPEPSERSEPSEPSDVSDPSEVSEPSEQSEESE